MADEDNNERTKVLTHALDVFGSQERADSWLDRPSLIFKGRTPRQILAEKPAVVEEELIRIDHGMFA